MASLTPSARGAPPGGAGPRLTRFLILAGCCLFVLFTSAPHSAQKGPAAARELKVWIEAGHSLVCPADGTARLRLRVRGVGEGCQPRYSWGVNGGFIEGGGAEVVWNLFGVRPQADKYYDAVVTVNTGPACGSRKASAVWRACVVCPPYFVAPPPTPPRVLTCPSISLGCPATTRPGLSAPFVASLSGGTQGIVPTFNWTLSGGEVVGSRNTSAIRVNAKGFEGKTILATVNVGGYGRRCSASCLSEVSRTGDSERSSKALNLSVSVRNARDGRAVPRAKIFFYLGGSSPVAEAESDEGGAFALSGWAPGVYRVRVVAERFDPQESTVTLDRFSTGSVVLSLKPSAAPPTPTPTPTPTPSSTPTPSPGPSATPAPTEEESGTSERDSKSATLVGGWNFDWVPMAVILLALAAAVYLLLTQLAGATTAAGESGLEAAVAKESGDEVHCTVYAPEQAAPGDPIIVQVFAHLEDQVEQLAGIAAQAGDEQRARGSKQLDQRITRETKLTFRLDMPGLEVLEPEHSLVWRGKVDSVSFAVDVPVDFKPRNVRGIVKIYYDDAPVGQIMFLLKVVEAGAAQPAPAQTPAPAPQEKFMYKHAFVSYSSKDRPKVLARMQGLERGLKRAGITCFMDKQDIEPGEQWSEALRRQLDNCDLFYLFWSSNAKTSEEVKKEIDYALARKGEDERRPPFFEPFTIELPLPTPLPKGLESLHFVEPILYEIKAEEALAAEKADAPSSSAG